MKKSIKKTRTTLVASYTAREARQILGELTGERFIRKKGEAYSPAEECLLDLMYDFEYGYRKGQRNRIRNRFICLALSFKYYPVPKWWIVKREMAPEKSKATKISWFAAEQLLVEKRQF